jgi:hypothetical protein
MTYEQVRLRALAMWREREMRFPAFTRRMQPDEWDHATGSWAAMVSAAAEAIRRESAACPAP